MVIDLDARKQEILLELKEVELDCLTLLDKITAYREDLAKVKSASDAAVFDETHDLEEGLKHIRLF